MGSIPIARSKIFTCYTAFLHMAAKQTYLGSLSFFFAVLFICSLTVFFLVLRSFETYSFANATIERSISDLESAITIGERKSAPLDLPILVYHYIEVVTDVRDTIRQSLSITPQVFEAQILTLIAHGYEPVTMSEVSDYFAGKADLPQKPVVLTFDDGYRDFYTDVFPILKQYHVPAALFITSGFLDSTQNYLTTNQLLEISQEKLIEINSHTIYHPDLRQIPLNQAGLEIRNGKSELEKLIDRPVDHFAFPFGGYTPQLVHEVEAAGFKTAVTTDFGTIQNYTSRYIFKRIRPGSLTGDSLLNLLNSN